MRQKTLEPDKGGNYTQEKLLVNHKYHFQPAILSFQSGFGRIKSLILHIRHYGWLQWKYFLDIFPLVS